MKQPDADRAIIVSREFNAPRELVWEAWTKPEHVTRWWGPRGFSTTTEVMDVRTGGEWKHVMHGPDGANYPNHSVFTEVVKHERIVFEHGGRREGGPGVHFVSTWTFEALSADRTRLTVCMVFPTAKERDFVAKEFGAIEGAHQTMGRLAEHLSTVATPEPFVISREFSAPRELVWKAWTERERLLGWFGPKGSKIDTATLDFRPGGIFHYSMRTPDGKRMWGKFTYLELATPERILLISSFSDENGGITRHPFSAGWPLEMLTETTFTERGGKTTVTIKWLPFNATAEERQTFNAARGGMSQGWSGTFEQLDEYLTKNQK